MKYGKKGSDRPSFINDGDLRGGGDGNERDSRGDGIAKSVKPGRGELKASNSRNKNKAEDSSQWRF